MSGPGADDLVQIELLDVSIETVRFAQRHHDALIRELELITLGPDQLAAAEMADLRADEARLRELFATFRPLVEDQLAAASPSESPAERDLELLVPADVAELADEANAVFDRLEDRCGGGSLLLARPPRLSSGFRRWFLAQMADQARGGQPESWPRWWASHGDGSSPVPSEDPQAP